MRLAAPASPLDGTQWQVKVTPDEEAAKKGEKVFDDTLIFDAGKLTLTECVKYGFAASHYKAMRSTHGWSFISAQKSDAEGDMTCTADVVGDAIRGKMVWKKKDGTVLNYTFEGKKAS